MTSTQNMNFKCWPSLLLVMDQKVPLRSREQMKMVRGHIRIEFELCFKRTIFENEFLWMPFFWDRSPLNASCSFSSFRFRFLSTSWHIAKNKKKRHISSNLTKVVFHDIGVHSEAKIHVRLFFLNFLSVSYLKDSQEKLSLSPKYNRRNITLFGLIGVRSSRFKNWNTLFAS